MFNFDEELSGCTIAFGVLERNLRFRNIIMVMLSVLTLQLGILGKLLRLMDRIVKRCVREVSLAQVSCILMYVYVAPPTPVGAWSMALGLRQRFEYYYYYVSGRLP